MESNKNLLSAVNALFNTGIERPVFIHPIELIEAKGHRAKRFLFASDVSLYILKHKKFSKRLKVSRRLDYYQLFSISVANQDTVTLDFPGTKYTFIDYDAFDTVCVIREVLLAIMIPNELPIFEFDDVAQTNVPGNPGLRFIAKNINDPEVKITESDSNMLREYFKKRPTELLVSKFSTLIPYFDKILSSLVVSPECCTLVVDANMTNSICNLLGQVLKNNMTISKIVFRAPISGDLSTLANSFERTPPSPIYSLTFENFQLDENNVDGVAKILAKQKITELIMNNCMDGRVSESFCQKLENIENIRKINIINFSKLKKLDYSLLIPVLSNVKELKIVDCEAEITKILMSLNTSGFKALSYLNLSENYAKFSNININELPLTLNNIVLNLVDWEFDVFLEVFKILIKHTPKARNYHLSLSDIHFHIGNWNIFFKEILGYPVNKILNHLDWISNPLHPNFFSWIEKSPKLTKLNLRGCNSSSFNFLVKHLNQTKRLKKLYINYDDDKPANLDNNQIEDFIQAIENNRSLVTLSIIGFPLNDDYILKLSKVLMVNRRITSLKYDFLGADSFDTVSTFFHNLVDRGTKLKVKWPEEFMLKNPWSEEKKEEFAQSFETVNRGNHLIVPPPESVEFAKEDEKIEEKNEKSVRETDSYYQYYSAMKNTHQFSSSNLPDTLETTSEGLPPPPSGLLDIDQQFSADQNYSALSDYNSSAQQSGLINQFGYEPDQYGDHGFLPSVPTELQYEGSNVIPGISFIGYDNQNNCDALSSQFCMKAHPPPQTDQKANKTPFKFKVARH